MVIRAEQLGALTALVSAPRLAPWEKITGSAASALELHQDILSHGCRLMNVVALVEIGVRNAVSDNLAQYFGVGDWLQRPPVDFKWREHERNQIKRAVQQARKAKYGKLSQVEKAALDAAIYPVGRPPNESHWDRAKKRQSRLPISEGDVIAQMTLSFWKSLFGPEYEHHLWRPTLKRLFPDKSVRRGDVALHLENIYQARNRLAHHEAVLRGRFDEAIIGITYISERLGFYPPSPHAPLASLISDEVASAIEGAKRLHSKIDTFRVG